MTDMRLYEKEKEILNKIKNRKIAVKMQNDFTYQ